jgi:V8-like Glu-specific endopeptidase
MYHRAISVLLTCMDDTNSSQESQSPLDARGRARLYADVKVTEPPQEVAKLLRASTLPTFKTIEVDRELLRREGSAEVLRPFRPDWQSASVRPGSRHPVRARARVQRQGRELDPLTIWQPDDRRIYYDTSYPWGLVCRIAMNNGSTGSGVIVGPRHVLTANHVVDWATGGAGVVEVLRYGASTLLTTSINAVWSYPGVQLGTSIGYTEVDEDYAVLITQDPIGDMFGRFGVRTYNSSWDDEPYWFNVGYPGDIGGSRQASMFPIWQRDKELDEDEVDYGSGRGMTTTADTFPGQSGGPMFAFWDEGPYVVSVVSAQGQYYLSGDENWCAGGSDLTRLVNFAIAGSP